MIDIIGGILTFIGVSAIGFKKRIGWVFSILGQLCYIYVGYEKILIGLIILNIALTIMSIRNYHAWGKK